jgi:hypothetical protein
MSRDNPAELFTDKDEERVVPVRPVGTAVSAKTPDQPARPPAPTPAPETEAPDDYDDEDAVATLHRIEHTLDEIRRTLQNTAREQRHREFSPARLIASVLQALVIGMVLWALSDWVFEEPRESLLVKLSFAAVLQLGALAGFTLGREIS